jgi:hypothetical protein
MHQLGLSLIKKMKYDTSLPCFTNLVVQVKGRLVIPIAERLCRKRSCEFPGSGFKITYCHEWLNT